jgi:hypothetical protein
VKIPFPGRRRTAPARTPHPDPVTETRLQRILSLQAAVARQEAAAVEHLEELRSARKAQEDASYFLRVNNYAINSGGNHDLLVGAATARAVAAQSRLGEAESAIAVLHDEIAKRTGELDPNDLSYL